MYNNGTVSNSTTTNYTYGDTNWGDLLTGYDGEGITYDSVGNPLSYYNGKRYTFSWAYGRRLASSIVDGKTNTYTYNMDGIRLTKTVDGVEHTYYYDGGQLIAETWGNSYLRFTYDENGTLLRVYYHNGTTTTMYYYVLNLQGDVLEIRDTANNVVCRYSYDAWGKILSIKDGSGNAITSAGHIGNINPMRYRGYYYDTETGLYYLQSRYYDPVVGRFISPDSYISTGQGLVGYNRFAYCGNNPVVYEDTLGTYFWEAIEFPSPDGELVPRDINGLLKLSRKKENKGPRKDPRKGSENRQQSGARERNVGHQNGEEHSRVPKGNRYHTDVVTPTPHPDVFAIEAEPAPAPDIYIGEFNTDWSGACNFISDACVTVGSVGVGYVLYRGVRFLISLLPPLWWTMPINVAAP